MNKTQQMKKLQQRARAFIAEDSSQPSFSSDRKLEADLHLHKIELELQNAELRESEILREEILNKYQNLYNLAPVAYFILDHACLIQEVNQAGADLFHLEKASLVNKCFSRYVAPDSQLIFSGYKTNAFTTMETISTEVKLLSRNHAIFYAEMEGKAVINPATDKKEFFMFVTNISDRKETEKNSLNAQHELAKNDRHNSLNQLASTIAHELNNPLAVILNYVQGCIRRIENGNFQADELLNALKATAKQSTRASEIILRLKNFKNQGILKTEIVCIDSMIKEVIKLMQYEMADYPLEILYRSSKLPDVKVDRVHIQQVILNMTRNAVEALRDANIENPRLIIETNRISKDEIEISVIDNGPGFEVESVHQFFDPHFTTKNYGIGLGLAVSQSVIKAHGSELVAKLNPTGGACFSFTLKTIAE